MPTVVRKKPGQSDDRLIADFSKKVLNDEIILELKNESLQESLSLVKQEKLRNGEQCALRGSII